MINPEDRIDPAAISSPPTLHIAIPLPVALTFEPEPANDRSTAERD